MSMDVAPPTPLSPNPNVPNAGTTSVTLNPPGGAQQDPDFLTARQASDASDAAVTSAQTRYDQLLKAFQDAQAAAQDPASIANPNVAEQLRSATAAFDTAQRDLANANTASANAKAKMVAAAETAASRAKDPDLKNYYTAHADQARAQADLAKAQGAALAAKTPAEVAQAQAAATEAIARAGALGLLTPAQAAQANADAAQKSAQAAQISALTPALARRAGAEATVAEVQAGVAPQVAQADLDKRQADVAQAKATVDETRKRIAAMPTEQQAKAAIDLGLADKQADLDAKNLQLEQARKLLPIAVQGAQANVAATQAGTAATLAGIGQKTLGPLYGIGDQIARLQDMIRSGQLDSYLDPATGKIVSPDADRAMQTYFNTQLTGATPFQAGQEQNRYQEAARQQDVGFAQTQLSNLTGAAGQAMGTFQSLAAKAPEGYGQQFAQGYADTMNQLWDQYNRLTPAAAPPSAVSQAPVVHINIGGGQPTSSSVPAAPAPAAPQLPAAPPPLPAAVGAAAPAAATSGTPDWFGALQQRQAASAQEQQAQGDVWQAHLDNWKDELDSGAVTMPGDTGGGQ